MENTKLDSTQFTMLGLTGSGKTCYLLGMYNKMAAGIKGFSLTTDSDTDVSLRRRYLRMEDPALGINRFPAGTDQQDICNFTLSHAMAEIMSFDWIDYPGGALDEQKSGNAEAFNKLTSYIQNSSSLFICVDGELIKGTDSKKIAQNIRKKCSGIINQFLINYKKENHFLPPVAIVVTKSDLCQPQSQKNWELILRESFDALLTEGNNVCSRFVCFIPVSLGEAISSDGYKGKLKPHNLELPILMGIYFSLLCKGIWLGTELNIHKKRLDNLREAINKEKNKFFLWRSNKKIENYKKIEEQISNLEEETNNKYRSVAIDYARILEVLDDRIKLIFFNGKKQKNFGDASVEYSDNTPDFVLKQIEKNEKN